MKITDRQLDDVRAEGFVVVRDFLRADEVAAARDALWDVYPRPEAYFDAPDAPGHRHLARSQFAGMRLFPYPNQVLNRLAVHPDLVNAAERFHGSTDLDLYKVELWAKYAGATDYDQPLHRDFGNHTLVVPKDDASSFQLTTFLLLSDVTEQDGPTHIVSRRHTDHVALVPPEGDPTFPNSLPRGALAEYEHPVVGTAGSLLLYTTTVFHRGTTFGAPGRSRFALLVDFQRRGTPWMGKMAWPNQALQPGWNEFISRASVRERDLFGFPRPGDPFWDDATLAGVAARYPDLDLTPYRSAVASD